MNHISFDFFMVTVYLLTPDKANSDALLRDLFLN